MIFFAIFFGIGIVLIPQKKTQSVKDFFDALNEVILKLIDLIMIAWQVPKVVVGMTIVSFATSLSKHKEYINDN